MKILSKAACAGREMGELYIHFFFFFRMAKYVWIHILPALLQVLLWSDYASI